MRPRRRGFLRGWPPVFLYAVASAVFALTAYVWEVRMAEVRELTAKLRAANVTAQATRDRYMDLIGQLPPHPCGPVIMPGEECHVRVQSPRRDGPTY